MSQEPFFTHLKDAFAQAGHDIEGDITRLFHHGRYHQPTPDATVPKGTTMNLTQIAADIRGDIQAAENKAAEVYAHVKTTLELHLPQIEDAAKTIGGDRLFELALDATVPASVRAIGAELIDKLLAAFPPAAPAAPAEPETPPVPADDADVPAEPAEVAS